MALTAGGRSLFANRVVVSVSECADFSPFTFGDAITEDVNVFLGDSPSFECDQANMNQGGSASANMNQGGSASADMNQGGSASADMNQGGSSSGDVPSSSRSSSKRPLL